ncbi:MAG: Fe-S protein assembly co-chaperone HscB [Porticoccaceae bacterium]|jgi:molecular chaperone HscB|nr:Fe-S protein assembly co-chaperone HscB [Porticoccaceae bacterium]MBT6027569.1 Fe-S protein assembly co-chaperone HscB [Porticoccaceae bacterium]MBT6693347.1 Fe-S protein assembly co-chaperone HscB [Porticoccaceae bacterium]MBT6799463.1 Fe-S protein assembly co-chaperone HscB [Porticoccaceae bacterium]MBT7167305.1 Fe-S protein assembly co-chaperone HscB [Porticoccaceae bacterium]
MWLRRELSRLTCALLVKNSQSDGPLNFSSDFFAVFSISPSWDVDIDDLGVRYRKLQQEFHPDRYATKSDTEKRVAVQAASFINQAFDTLKSPLKRAQYLLTLEDIDIDQETHITSDAGFLMRQIELRETLSEISNKENYWQNIETLRADVESTYYELQAEFKHQYESELFDDAFNAVAKMQFFTKLLVEIGQLEAELEDA